jgi:hypothetical protein
VRAVPRPRQGAGHRRPEGRAGRLWSAPAEAWFPRRVPGRTGGRIATVLSFVRAKVTGDRLDVANGTVDLR